MPHGVTACIFILWCVCVCVSVTKRNSIKIFPEKLFFQHNKFRLLTCESRIPRTLIESEGNVSVFSALRQRSLFSEIKIKYEFSVTTLDLANYFSPLLRI